MYRCYCNRHLPLDEFRDKSVISLAIELAFNWLNGISPVLSKRPPWSNLNYMEYLTAEEWVIIWNSSCKKSFFYKKRFETQSAHDFRVAKQVVTDIIKTPEFTAWIIFQKLRK